MNGSDVTRTCAMCVRHVHDLSAMTTTEAEALLFAGTERICVRYVRGADGAILTADRLVKIQKGPYAGLSAAALAAAVALSLPSCSTPASQPAVSEREQPVSDRAGVTARSGLGTLSGRVHGYTDVAINGARVVVISESTGEEHVTRTRDDGEFSLELPAGSYTISVTDGELSFPAGEGGVEVRSGRISAIDFELHVRPIGEYSRAIPDTSPPPLPELNEPLVSTDSRWSLADAWGRLVERAKRLMR